jgi:hypothetical protein
LPYPDSFPSRFSCVSVNYLDNNCHTSISEDLFEKDQQFRKSSSDAKDYNGLLELLDLRFYSDIQYWNCLRDTIKACKPKSYQKLIPIVPELDFDVCSDYLNDDDV